MRNIVTLLFFACAMTLSAQEPVKLYDEMCDPLQAVFCDYVKNESSQNFLSSSTGQYTGTIIDGKIYGWGFILAADGTRSFGQFRNGKNIFGISITDKIARWAARTIMSSMTLLQATSCASTQRRAMRVWSIRLCRRQSILFRPIRSRKRHTPTAMCILVSSTMASATATVSIIGRTVRFGTDVMKAVTATDTECS